MVTQVLCWNQASPGFCTEPARRVPGVGAALASPVSSVGSAWGVVSVCPELRPPPTHKCQHSCMCVSVQPHARSLACRRVGALTNLPGNTSTSVGAHTAQHSWFRARALVHSAQTPGFAHMHPLQEVLVPCRDIAAMLTPRVQLRKMDLGSPCSARGDGFGVTMPI